MGESHENLLKAVRHYQDSLDKYTENRNDGKLLHYMEKLYRLPIKVVHLEQTGVGRTVNGLRKLGGEVGDSAKSLVAKWKEMVVGEQEQEEEEDEEDEEEEEEEEEDDEEDGYQTGEEQSDSDDKEEMEEKAKDDSSSHKRGDSHRSEDRGRKSKHAPRTEEEGHKVGRKDRKHHKHNGSTTSSRHKSHKRKAEEESSSDEDTAKKRHKKEASSEDEERHKSKKKTESDSETENKTKRHEKRHKSKKRDSSSDVEESKIKMKEKQKEGSSKDKHRSSKKEEKRHEHSSKKAKDKKSDTSIRVKEVKELKPNKEKNDDNKKHKSTKSKTALSHNGIDSGSGASFAEALGMCEPSPSSSNTTSATKNNTKKKPTTSTSSNSSVNSGSEKKEKVVVKTEDSIPKLLKEPVPVPEPLDINISSLLPPITPNYRPLGNLINTEIQPKKCMTDYEALSNIMTSKNQRTKVYSGNKIGLGKVPSLFELCIRILQDNIDALEYTGGVPYTVLKPILEKSTPNQLYVLEHHNPYLIEDTDELWRLHCQKEFRNKKREEFESWREMYLRCLDERDAKLKALTANIKQAQDKSLPVRTTKLAYVDAVAKPPRNIARRQAKNGTAAPERRPAARLSLLATAGEAGRVAVPNPGVRAADRTTASAAKPKKAPLMLKSITSFKNRFKR